MVAGLFCLLWAMSAPASKKYWEEVGPTWDRVLNPTHYIEQK